MRRTLALLVLSAIVIFLSGCGESSDTNTANSTDTDINTSATERANNSNMAPTGGPGPEPENAGKAPAENANGKGAGTTENKSNNNLKEDSPVSDAGFLLAPARGEHQAFNVSRTKRRFKREMVEAAPPQIVTYRAARFCNHSASRRAYRNSSPHFPLNQIFLMMTLSPHFPVDQLAPPRLDSHIRARDHPVQLENSKHVIQNGGALAKAKPDHDTAESVTPISPVNDPLRAH